MNELTKLILEDMKPALGVTEPAAIALACAKAKALTTEKVQQVIVSVNSGIYKNAFTCGIPGTAEVGNDYSAALGIVCGDADKGLCILEDVTDAAVEEAKALVAEGKIKVTIDSISSVLYIGARVETEHDVCIAELRGAHTNFCHIEKNGQVLLHKEYNCAGAEKNGIVNYSVAQIVEYAETVPGDELNFIDEAYKVNENLADAGSKWARCIITRSLIEQNGGKIISDDVRMSAKTLACAAAEARVLGMDKPAMSITGSGTHGIICTLPIAAFCKVNGISREKQLRATAISYLITMYIKEFSGKLSAFCGCSIAGGTGLACALTYLMGGDAESLGRTINNMSASITGLICTGGNHCCCLKVISAVDLAFTAASLSTAGAGVSAPHGICAGTAEKTMRNVGLIADPGMVETEKVIVDIMRGTSAN